MRQLLERSQPYRIILGARNVQRAQAAYDALAFDRDANKVTVLPLELNNLRNVQTFAKETLASLGQDKVDYLMIGAAITNGSEQPGPHGSKWCESHIVNHLCRSSPMSRADVPSYSRGDSSPALPRPPAA